MIASVLLRCRNNALRTVTRLNSQGQGATTSPASSSAQMKDLPGLSSACVAPASQPVGPGVDPKKTGAYKVPEYYLYNNMTYFEAEVEMQKFRNPQPSAIKK